MRKLVSVLLLLAAFGLALASPATADTGTASIAYQCGATYTGGSTTGLFGTTLRDELKSQIDSALAEEPISVDLDYDTPDSGEPNQALATDPSFGVEAFIPSFEIPPIDGVTVEAATLTVNAGGFGTINLSGAGVSPDSIQQAFPIPAWSPLDLKNPPAEGVAAGATISGSTTPSSEGVIAYRPGPVRIVATLYGRVSTFFGASSVTQPITIDCTPVAPAADIGPGTTVAVPDPYPCRADRPAEAHSFGDVSAGKFYNDAVSWLVASNITSGVAPGRYAPDDPVTRGQMATFLWRLQCRPAPEGTHGFTDVGPTSFYDTPVSWLVEAGITSGTAPGRFSPDGNVTRGQMAAFLWRLAGSPIPAGPPGFGDVPSGRFYTEPVAWLVETNITQGTAPGVFSPDAPVTRGQMAVFLDRYDTNT